MPALLKTFQKYHFLKAGNVNSASAHAPKNFQSPAKRYGEKKI